MPYVPPLKFTDKQIDIIKTLMEGLGYNDINKLVRRALSVFNSLVKASYGPNKKIYLIEAPPEEIKLSHNGKHYILDTSKVRVLSIPLLHKYKK